MSVLAETGDFIVISHEIFLNKVYRNVNSCTYTCRTEFFDIFEPFKVCSRSKKRKYDGLESEDVILVEAKYDKIKDRLVPILEAVNENRSKDVKAKDVADMWCTQAKNRESGMFKGGNLFESGLIGTISGETYLLPSKCTFFNYDVKEISNHIQEKFDIIVLDPPWWNKFIRRKRAANSDDCYNMMWNRDLADIPIGSLLENNGLVAVWCTNAPSHIESLRNEIFQSWGVQFVSQWFWLKVTRKGEVVTPFSPARGKQPFERIIFGLRDTTRSFPLPEPSKIIVSVPSAIHSHKPPLCQLLEPYLPSNPKGLEIFARSLLPNWTSYGNEVVKLQHTSLFRTSSYS